MLIVFISIKKGPRNYFLEAKLKNNNASLFRNAENNAKFCGITSLSACIFSHAIFTKGQNMKKLNKITDLESDTKKKYKLVSSDIYAMSN